MPHPDATPDWYSFWCAGEGTMTERKPTDDA
jgi:hypothetical protein